MFHDLLILNSAKLGYRQDTKKTNEPVLYGLVWPAYTQTEDITRSGSTTGTSPGFRRRARHPGINARAIVGAPDELGFDNRPSENICEHFQAPFSGAPFVGLARAF